MKSLRLVVVEDDVLLGLLLGDIFAAMGHDVCATETTEAGAVAAAARHRPDLMIVDAWLCDGSGVAAMETICRTRFVPHVFATGDVASVKVLSPHAIVLEKPYNEIALMEAMEHALAVCSAAGTGCRTSTTEKTL